MSSAGLYPIEIFGITVWEIRSYRAEFRGYHVEISVLLRLLILAQSFRYLLHCSTVIDGHARRVSGERPV